MITLTESDLIEVFLREVDVLESRLPLYKRPGEYGYKQGYGMKNLGEELERLRGAYDFIATALRSKERGSGHNRSTRDRYVEVREKARKRMAPKKIGE